ncbi:MAG: hypothetical protein U5N86_03225 [Planctomycetota bacterium]|nr:hypothetical protein [Planctomycetota bacterium]
MNVYCRILLLVSLAGLLIAFPKGDTDAAITDVSSVTIPGRQDTLDEGTHDSRKMLLFNVQTDSPTTITELSIWLEGVNLKSLGSTSPDGYQRSVNKVALYQSDSNATQFGLAFNGAEITNEHYVNPQDNEIHIFSQITWGVSSSLFLNLIAGNNYFLVVYEFDKPNSQAAGATESIAGERYWTRLDYFKTVGGTTTVANIGAGPQLYISGDVVGTTFEMETTKYDDRTVTGIPVDPVVIMPIRVTTSGTTATWTDFLIRGEGSGDDTRVSSIQIYEDTTGDGVYSPASAGPPSDTLVDTVNIPFFTDNGQVYHIFNTPVTIQPDSTKLFFFTYAFDPTAPDPTDNEFALSVVNFGGTFKILEPYDLSTLVTPTVTLLPLPPGIDVAIGDNNPPTQFINSTPTLTQRFDLMQVKLTAHGMDAEVTDMTFVYNFQSTAVPETMYSLELWLDANNAWSGFQDSSDVLLGTLNRDQIINSINDRYEFHFTEALKINMGSFANILLVGIFTDQATAAYGYTVYGDGVEGNFDFVRFFPAPAPLPSNYIIFQTTPPTSPTPTPTPPPVVTPQAPPVGDGGASSGSSAGSDTGLGEPGAIYGEGGGGCFVATASFGTMSTAEVAMLCALRDGYLSSADALNFTSCTTPWAQALQTGFVRRARPVRLSESISLRLRALQGE